MSTKANNKVSLWYLFTTFLKIGSASFGGFMSLIAVVQNQLAERDKVIENETVLDGISLTSVLPGPVAVNTVAYIGNQLRGVKGALISMLGVIIPSFILICTLSHFYFEYGQFQEVKLAFKGILPVVCAIIVAIAYKMARKNIKDYRQVIMALIAAALLLFTGGFWTTFIVLVTGGLLGYLVYHPSMPQQSIAIRFDPKLLLWPVLLIITCMGIVPLVNLMSPEGDGSISQSFSILGTFSSISISLFGGGYVFLPVMQEIIVEHYHWVLQQEFADGIALGQITPGPIMITATFIGYKLMGVWGAAVATVGMFLPPGLLTIYCSRFFDTIRSSSAVQAIFKGVRAVVIGMILSSAFIIGKDLDMVWQSFLLGGAALGLSIFTNINLIYLIVISGILGIVLF